MPRDFVGAIAVPLTMYQGAFLMRGLANVRAEFSLTALAYNLRRGPTSASFCTVCKNCAQSISVPKCGSF